MNLNEAAALLQKNRDTIKIAISDGIELPLSKIITKLAATKIGDEYEIEEIELNTFIKAFDDEEPGRHPPAQVRRELLVEATHRCAICKRDEPIEFHHIVEFSQIKHYDTRQMIAICRNCHARCGLGEIDRKSQREYKTKLTNGSVNENYKEGFISVNEPIRFSWDDLKDLITTFHIAINFDGKATSESKYDFSGTEIEEKNRLNKLGEEYFAIMKAEYEPYFSEVFNFLKSPINSEISELYYEIVDELRQKIAANRDKFDRFEQVLIEFGDAAFVACKEQIKGKRRVLNVLLSFMYFECDIGRKK
jgi:hypothetical protein